ncbi:MAG: rubrerythrin family protein [Candidatus Woesearchaeota archaeon]
MQDSNLKKFKTVENLAKAFVGECMARNRYTFYASTAKKEGYEQISEIFTITADNEREHASWFYKMLMEIRDKYNIDLSDLKIETHVPVLRASTLENLKGAIIGETEEFSMLYPEFAKVAEEEGFKEIAARIRAIAVAEKHHAERYSKLRKELEQGSLFKKEKEIFWVCRECGYVHYGTEPPEKCPSCGHERGFYQVMCENY